MPVLVPWRASTDTVNAVRWLSVLSATISGRRSSSRRLALDRHADHAAGVADHERHRLGRHGLGGHDEVALVLAVGVVDDDDDLAALDRRRRRSRSSVKGMMTPTRWSAATRRRSTYLASDVDLEVDGIARLAGAQRGDGEGVRDDRDRRTPSSSSAGDGEADAVDGDRPLLDDVAQHRGGCGEGHPGGAVGQRGAVRARCRPRRRGPARGGRRGGRPAAPGARG